MRVYKKEFYGVKVRACRDGLEWVVWGDEIPEHRFPAKKFRMKHCMKFTALGYRLDFRQKPNPNQVFVQLIAA